eukprot:Pgem_evm1s18303
MIYQFQQSLENFLKCDNGPFLNFVAGCLQWRPEDRMSPSIALNDPWLQELFATTETNNNSNRRRAASAVVTNKNTIEQHYANKSLQAQLREVHVQTEEPPPHVSIVIPPAQISQAQPIHTQSELWYQQQQQQGLQERKKNPPHHSDSQQQQSVTAKPIIPINFVPIQSQIQNTEYSTKFQAPGGGQWGEQGKDNQQD